MKKLSIVIPLKNEEKSIPELWSRIKSAMASIPQYEYEVILIDDGSTDGTATLVRRMAATEARLKLVSFVRNFGKAAALSAGFDYATGDYVLTMDGDLQHEPEEIPNFVVKLEEGNDMVISWRHKRRDNAFSRKFPSYIANRMIERMSGLKLHDFGGTFHAYRRELLDGIELYSELHRFIPAMVNWKGSYKYAELPINNPDRKYGKSNYGLWRIIRVFFDLLSLKYFQSYLTHSLFFFGLSGLVLMSIGTLGAVYLIVEKLRGVLILVEHGPLFIISIFILLAGLQLILFGLLAEVLSRIYHYSASKKTYKTKSLVNL